MVELVLATRNRHKGQELAALLGDLGIRIRTLDDFPEAPEVEEDGLTCEANAIKKATEISRATGLRELVSQGAFRRDLYFRLNVAHLCLPPLRERAGDVLLLAEHFTQRYRGMYAQPDRVLDRSTATWLARQSWPGNVRELENLLHREFVLSEGSCVALSVAEPDPGERRSHAGDRRNTTPSARTSFRQAKAVVISEFERRYLEAVLAETGGNVSAAARQAGKERRALGKLIKKYGLHRGGPHDP